MNGRIAKQIKLYLGEMIIPGILVMFLGACVIGCVTVKPVVVDRKTQLENQILGTFQRLEEDLILASSVRGEKLAVTISPLQREAVEAMMTREFFRDDIEELKTKQVMGEANTGLLVILSLPGEPELAKRAKYLVEEENRSRRVILQRVINSNRELSEKDLPLIQRIFYRLNLQTARTGDKVQKEDGTWQVVTITTAETSTPAPTTSPKKSPSR